MTKHKNFLANTSGISWVWGIFVIFLVLGAVVFFPLSYAWDTIYQNVVGQYTFTGDTALGITVIQLIMSYMMAFAVIFAVNWMIVNSKASAYDQ